MEAVCVYQPVSNSRHYFYHYRDLQSDYGTEYATLLVYEKDPVSGWPLVDREPLAVGGFYRREATSAEKKELMSRALLNYKEPKPVEHDETCWKNLWDEITFKLNRYD